MNFVVCRPLGGCFVRRWPLPALVVLLFTLVACPVRPLLAQSTLSAGDIAFTGYNASVPDSQLRDDFSFILLVPTSRGTTIEFTDCGWHLFTGLAPGNGVSETYITWVSERHMEAGEQVKINGLAATTGRVTGTPLRLSGSGDQILAFQGRRESPSFLAGIHANYNPGNPFVSPTNWSKWDDSNSNPTMSGLPPGLRDGISAVALFLDSPEKDNAIYNGRLFDPSPRALAADINNRANWLFDDLKIFPLPPPFFTGGDEEPPGPELPPAPPKELGIRSEGEDRLVFISDRPDTEFVLQYATSLMSHDWKDLARVKTFADGDAEYRDAAPAGPVRIYRLLKP